MRKTTQAMASTHVKAGHQGASMIPVTGKQGDSQSSQAG